MAKNDKGSWVGHTIQPQYATYQTAGMLRPPVTAPPPPIVAPVDVPVQPIGIVDDPVTGVWPPTRPEAAPAAPVDRAPLVAAAMNAGFSFKPRSRAVRV